MEGGREIAGPLAVVFGGKLQSSNIQIHTKYTKNCELRTYRYIYIAKSCTAHLARETAQGKVSYPTLHVFEAPSLVLLPEGSTVSSQLEQPAAASRMQCRCATPTCFDESRRRRWCVCRVPEYQRLIHRLTGLAEAKNCELCSRYTP